MVKKRTYCSHHTTYWQHGDHLGSASWVTNINGVGCQHLQYLPWGEQWVDQRKTGYSYNTRYTFSGKERDEETGFSYFGARYYQPNLSIWLSVDPMADKYPGVSPYTYCGDNPVRLVDVDGREIWILGSESERNNAFYDMQNGTSLSLSMDENGRISTSGETVNGEKLTRADKKLLKAINDQNVIANIYVSSSNNENSAGGAYMGTEYDHSTKTATSCNSVNLEKMQLTEQKYGAQSGSGIIHEATEGYKAGLIAIKNKTSIKEAATHIESKHYEYSEFGLNEKGQRIELKTTVDYEKKVPNYPTDYKYYKKAHRWAVRVSQ